MSNLWRLVRIRGGWILLIAVAMGLWSCGENINFDPNRAVYKDFSGSRALVHVEEQMAMGPRVSGSKNLEVTRLYLERVLNESGWDVARQVFRQKTPFGEIEFVNMRARFVGVDGIVQGLSESKRSRLWERSITGVVTSHYETKKFNGFEFVGANDPGSSVGALLEMARVLAGRAAVAEKLELVFFDGEEAFVNYTDEDGLYGSRYYAESLQQWSEKSRPKWGILLDMVGDKDLGIRVPEDSPVSLVENMFAAADELELRKYFGMGSQVITDDHKPLNEAGIPTIDIIDMDYSFWHTPGDKADKLSEESLETVGKVTLLMIEKYLLDKSAR